jgi:hypothetical protein
VKRLLVALLLLSASASARADSGRWGSFELRLSNYHPNVDSQGGGAYDAAFGSNRPLMYRALVSKSVYTGVGSLEVGVGGGYFEDRGKGLDPVTLAPTGESTVFQIFPATLAVTYRFDWLAQRYRWVPLVPYVRGAFERYWWRVKNGSGDTATFNGDEGKGATNGVSFTTGLALLLDAFDGQLARESDLDSGINETYLYADLTWTKIDDFGSSKSFNLSDSRWTPTIGLLFVF